MKFKLIPILLSILGLLASAAACQTLAPFPGSTPTSGSPSLSLSEISDNRADFPGGAIPRYAKLEITFQIQHTAAQNFQFPYDPTPPSGIDPALPEYNGISVDAYFLPPGGTDWGKAFHQPAFYYQYFDEQTKQGWEGQAKDWFYPTGSFAWKARFSPDQIGAWQYRLFARDANGSVLSSPQTFDVTSSGSDGFVKVSAADSRYFEYDSGKPFIPQGFNGGASFKNPLLANRANFQAYGQNGINLDRIWISGIYGTAWLEWLGGRNIYDGYLPRSGTETFHDPIRNRDTLSMVIDYEPGGDTGWYDACRFQFWNDPEAVKPDTNYRLQIQYWGEGISGPRAASQPEFGVVGKIGGDGDVNCYEPGVGNVVTNYGKDTSDWETISGTWNSGSNNFLPRIYLGIENVLQGKANIRSISLREDLGNGALGPEILRDAFLDYETYFREQSARALDQIVKLAEQNGVFLKLVLMEKNDMLYAKINDDGSLVSGGQPDNGDGFYGLGRTLNKTRWLQQAWWRYLQARWGYSPAIQSWEATNEGDPWQVKNYQLSDELGKFMHCEVFGIAVPAGDGQKCMYDHPNSHLVTTSFWTSFPATQFWMNSSYPNLDFADLHAYVSTSDIGLSSTDLAGMQWDSAGYHLGHSLAVGGWKIGKPVMRGEAGIDALGDQTEQPGLALDKNGVWLHNFLWASLDPGGMSELYWWMDNISTQPGPDGQPGLYEIYRYFANFMRDIPINNGHYVDIQASLSEPALRVTGQKDTQANRAHVWVQAARHTWKNVVDGVSGLGGLTGTVAFSGFAPNRTFKVEWNAFKTDGLPVISHTEVTSDGQGRVVLTLPADPEITDVGIKIGEYPSLK